MGCYPIEMCIRDRLDDPENIHIDKARFGVAFLLVQPLDVAVSEFDFEAAQLPGDGEMCIRDRH